MAVRRAGQVVSHAHTKRPYPTPLDILRHIVLRSCHRLLLLETWSQQGSVVHPTLIRGHEHFRSVFHCRECITVFCSWDPGHMPPPPHSAGHLQVLILVKVIVLLGGDTERRRNSKKVANSVDNLRMSSPGGSVIATVGVIFV